MGGSLSLNHSSFRGKLFPASRAPPDKGHFAWRKCLRPAASLNHFSAIGRRQELAAQSCKRGPDIDEVPALWQSCTARAYSAPSRTTEAA